MAKPVVSRLDSPIKAIDLNRDGSQVVAAGKNWIRIINIEKDALTERENLRFPKKPNTSGSCTDIAWNPVDENVLASPTTAGHVCIWNLGINLPTKLEHTFVEHRRTVNRVCFHPNEAHYLLSGSQDSTAMLFDLRTKEPCTVFRCVILNRMLANYQLAEFPSSGAQLSANEEAVRDVRFNPHHYFQFAVCLENGNVQMFDYRKSEMCEREFTCHIGSVFQSHFHPTEKNLIATCGRDKCIKVWNFAGDGKNPTLESLIPSFAAISTIAWRPQRHYHLASTALVTDFSINVWDLRRPFIPFASFENSDSVTALAWRNDPQVLLAGSKDGTLSMFSFASAKRPADNVNPVGLDIGCYGTLAQACSQRIIEGHGQNARPKLDKVFEKPVSPSEEFPLNAASQLVTYASNDLKILSMDWFVTCAKEYKLYGGPVSDLCNHNATVAESAGRQQVAQVWRVVGFIYSCSESRSQKSSHASCERRTSQRPLAEGRDDLYTSRNLDSSGMGDIMYDSVYQRNRRHTHNKDVTALTLDPSSSNMGDFLFNEQTAFEEVDTPFTGMETMVDEDRWQLPSEGFQIRMELPDRSHGRADGISSKVDMIRRDRNRSGSLGPEDTGENGLRLDSLLANINHGPMLDFTERMQDAIHFSANQGDLQTAVSLVLVLGDRGRGMVGEEVLEAWLLDYIDLLSRYQLFAIANDVIKLCQVPSVRELNQQSTTVHTSCNLCSRHLHKLGWYCTACRKYTNSCSICQLPVRGLYVWCQGCSHGGHLQHIQEWMKKSAQCPTGCGHYCEYI